MPGLYTEADYENSIIELFQNMGYREVQLCQGSALAAGRQVCRPRPRNKARR